MAMQPKSQQSRPDSPGDPNGNILQHLVSADRYMSHQNSNSNMYNTALQSEFQSTSNYSYPEQYADQDGLKQHQQQSAPQANSKAGGFAPASYRSSFSAFPNTTSRQRNQSSASVNDNASNQFYTSPNDMFAPQLTSPPLQHMQAAPSYDSRASLDFGNPQSSQYMNAGSREALLQTQSNKQSLQSMQPSAYQSQSQYMNGMGLQQHLSSQTPYGPHISSNGLVNGVPSGPGGMNGMTQNGLAAMQSQINGSGQEEISTIFVVGFPEDMQEREFQNMFTFSPGFEAATLKVPNKDYTAYGGTTTASSLMGGLSRQSLQGNASLYAQYGGSNDPYNLVTVNQGGVVVDGGRDGTVASWPAASIASDDGNSGHFLLSGGGGALNTPPRKQIIGFAKFRSRAEALEARDVLQGRRVDIEKGAVLKAEMAKKNLHTKRGVGPVGVLGGPGMMMGMGGDSIGLAGGMGMGAGGGSGPTMSLGEVRERERELQQNPLATMGLLNNMTMGGWRDHERERLSEIVINNNGGNLNGRLLDDDRRERESRETGLINAMGLGGVAGSTTRGPRERAEDDERERERRRKDKFRPYDPFNSGPLPLPISRQGSSGLALGMGLTSPPGANAILDNGYGQHQQHATSDDAVGPWDAVRRSSIIAAPVRPSSSRRSSSPNPNSHSTTSNSSSGPFSPQMQQQQLQHLHYADAQSASSTTGVAGGSQPQGPPQSMGMRGLNEDSEREMIRSLGGLAVSTTRASADDGNASPELTSPASAASSASARNVIDQNPPINTLYVGNLPTSPPPSGYPHDHLEDSLRDLFSLRPGFRRLCFRQKNNGPMCFVEFEDVSYATKALNDLYGHTLNGLVKGGGIRLSYSKNPLGVRTPTSAGSSGPTLEQQQLQNNIHQLGGASPFPIDAFQQMDVRSSHPNGNLRRELMVSPPPGSGYNSNNATYGAPRFFGNGNSSQLSGSSETFMPRNGGNHGLQAYNGGQNASSAFSPFGMSSPQRPTHSLMSDHDQYVYEEAHLQEQQHHHHQQQHQQNLHFTTSATT